MTKPVKSNLYGKIDIKLSYEFNCFIDRFLLYNFLSLILSFCYLLFVILLEYIFLNLKVIVRLVQQGIVNFL